MSDTGARAQTTAAGVGFVAAAAVLIIDLKAKIPTGVSAKPAMGTLYARAADALEKSASLATLGSFLRVVAAIGLLVAAAVFCYRAHPEDAVSGNRRWAPPIALACLTAWFATVVVASAVRGALLRVDMSIPGVVEDLINFALGLAEYVTALGLVPLTAGAIGLAGIAERWSGLDDDRAARTASAVSTTARLTALVGGAAAITGALRVQVEGLREDGNPFYPGSPLHGVVTATWVVLLATLAADGWRRRKNVSESEQVQAA